MKSYALFIVAIAAQSSDAFHVSSRKAFLSKAVATTTAGAAIIAAPNNASAADGVAQKLLKKKSAEKKQRKAAADRASDPEDPSLGKAGSNEVFRGGKQQADKMALGTDLNKKESEVAGGLMDKMGL